MKSKDKVGIVTGAAKGSGWGIAKVFLQEGARVAVGDWDEKTGKQAVAAFKKEGGEAIFIECDVSNERQVKSMVEKAVQAFGRLDILVNNAGVGIYKPVLETSSEDWDKCLGVNLKGVFLCSTYALPHIQQAGTAPIVNISSVHSHATVNGVAPYAASKGGITALTRNMAIDYGPALRVNSQAPGWGVTPLIQGIFDSYPDSA